MSDPISRFPVLVLRHSLAHRASSPLFVSDIHKSQVTPCSHLIFYRLLPVTLGHSLIPGENLSFAAGFLMGCNFLSFSLFSELYFLKAATQFPFDLHVARGYCNVSYLCFKTETAPRRSLFL